MKKIPTLFARDWDGDRRYVLPEVTPGCEWVIKGEGTPTRKYDGTCMMFDGERWWARREVKEGKTAPAGFVTLATDDETGKTVGWEPAGQSSFANAHASVLARFDPGMCNWRPGTYELCGPKVNGNPEGFTTETLVIHEDALELADAPRDFAGLAAWLHAHAYEGIVWHHDDGRMAKIKKRDLRAPVSS
jgi:Family of unknown function (DUF5565)